MSWPVLLGHYIIIFGEAYAVNTGALTTGDDGVLEVFICEGDTLIVWRRNDCLNSYQTRSAFTGLALKPK